MLRNPAFWLIIFSIVALAVVVLVVVGLFLRRAVAPRSAPPAQGDTTHGPGSQYSTGHTDRSDTSTSNPGSHSSQHDPGPPPQPPVR